MVSYQFYKRPRMTTTKVRTSPSVVGSKTVNFVKRTSSFFKKPAAFVIKKTNLATAEFNVHFKSVLNNIYITFTDKNGQVLFWSSTGTVGFKGSKRSNSFAAQAAANSLLRDVIKFRQGKEFKKYFVSTPKSHSRGFYNPKLNFYISSYPSWLVRSSFKVFFYGIRSNRNFYINNLFINSPLSHNGLRSKKPRRV